MYRENPFFSIIIPTMSEIRAIRGTLDSIARQSFRDYEVIVCDYKSTDGTIQIAREYDVDIIDINKPGASVARNRGALDAEGDYLVFLDADTSMAPDCLKFFKIAADSGALGGFPLVYWDTKDRLTDFFRRYIINPLYYVNSLAGGNAWPSCCCFYETDAFVKSGGFSENTPIYSSIDLNAKLKNFGKLKFVPNAKCFTSDRRVRDWGLGSYCITSAYVLLMKLIKDKEPPLDFYEAIR